MLGPSVFHESIKNTTNRDRDCALYDRVNQLIKLIPPQSMKWRTGGATAFSHKHGPNQAKRAAVPTMGERRRIGGGDQTTARKQIMVLMNKLSENNLETILKGVRLLDGELVDGYVTVIWDLMQRCSEYQPLYIQVLKALNAPDKIKAQLLALYDSWRADRTFPDPSQESYDEFCDYVKWKKRRQAAATAWLHLINEGLLEVGIQKSFSHFLETDLDPILIESNVEQLMAVAAHLPPMQKRLVADDLKQWAKSITGLGISQRCSFRLLDLCDLFGVKLS